MMNWGGDGNQFGDSSRMSSFNSPGAGGGFLDKTFGESPSSQDKKDRKKQSIMPVTTAMVLNAVHDPGTDMFVMNEVPVQQIELVGMVSALVENRTNLTYQLDDLTGGPVTVKRWVDQEENPEEYERTKFSEDTYVRVNGYMKRLDNDQKHIVAFSMIRLVDFNEITFHMLDVINSFTGMKKAMSEENNPNVTNNSNQLGNNSFSAGGSQFGQQKGNSNVSKNQARVLDMISAVKAEEGISIGDLARRLSIPEPSVREVVEHLSDEGHIYSTTDDEHFKSTNA